MSIFNINYPAFINYLLPVRRRRVTRVSWLNVLMAPVIYVYNLFMTNRNSNLYYLGHTGQVISLQAALNDVFDNTLRRIIITDPTYIDYLPIYLDAEAKSVWLYKDSETNPVWLYTETEISSTMNGFIVEVPTVIPFDTNHMKALIDNYRIAGKSTYTIITL